MGASIAAQSERDGAPLSWADDLGPAEVLYLYDPHCDLKAIVVLDNLALAPAIGGVRMAPNLTSSEVFRLARAMILKNGAVALPQGRRVMRLAMDRLRAAMETRGSAFLSEKPENCSRPASPKMKAWG